MRDGSPAREMAWEEGTSEEKRWRRDMSFLKLLLLLPRRPVAHASSVMRTGGEVSLHQGLGNRGMSRGDSRGEGDVR